MKNLRSPRHTGMLTVPDPSRASIRERLCFNPMFRGRIRSILQPAVRVGHAVSVQVVDYVCAEGFRVRVDRRTRAALEFGVLAVRFNAHRRSL